MTDVLDLAYGGEGVLGRDVKTNRPVRLREPFRSTYVIGAHGTGKSTLLTNMISADLAAGDKAVVVIDPHGDLVKSVARRCPASEAERVIYFSPSEQRDTPFGLNPFEWHQERERSERVTAILKVFNHLWYGSFSQTPTMQNTLEILSRILISAYPAVKTHFFHMLLLTGDDEVGAQWRRKLAKYALDNPVAARKWAEWQADEASVAPRTKADARPSQRKLDMQSSKDKIAHIIGDETIQHVLCQITSSACFRFQEMLASRRVLLINLNGLEAESQKLIGSIILTQILAMGYLREQQSQRVPCHLYADEFDMFSPAAFAEIISKARKVGIFVTIAHQSLSQVDLQAQRAALNCANKIVFQINAADAHILEPNFHRNSSFPEGGFTHLPLYTATVRVSHRRETQQAIIKTLKEQGQEDEEIAERIMQQSLVYGRPRTEVAKSIAELAVKRKSTKAEDDFWVDKE